MSQIPHFYYHPRMMSYDFGPQHPLKPERLRRTMELLAACAPGVEFMDPGFAAEGDVLRVHDERLMEAVKALSEGRRIARSEAEAFGFSSMDTPPFRGMHEASLAYVGGTVRAAEAVRDGAPLAFNMSGGLHHARRAMSNGFCVYDDPAVAVAILKERFSRVAYVDIDLHHGDGVQWIWYDDPDVLTLSIHQTGRTLYPGCGFLHETGADLSSINIPLEPLTTGLVWLDAFREVAKRAFDRFRPEAVVLQMGCDPHTLDPLGRLQVRVQDWLGAVQTVKEFGLPIVAVGGGGYRISNVPRMWTAAVLTLAGMEVPARMPDSIPADWGMTTFMDPEEQEPEGQAAAEEVKDHWKAVLG